MTFEVLKEFEADTPSGNIILREGQKIRLSKEEANSLIEEGMITPAVDAISWLEKLSDSEREIFEERAAIMEFDGGLEREQAEIEAIKRIIKERILTGKCDKCEKVNGCMLTKGMRVLCGGPF